MPLLCTFTSVRREPSFNTGREGGFWKFWGGICLDQDHKGGVNFYSCLTGKQFLINVITRYSLVISKLYDGGYYNNKAVFIQ